MKKSFMLVLTLLMVVLFYGVSYAGITQSPHDVVFWNNTSNLGVRVNTGVCSYCHIPHSAKGDRLFPISSDTAGVGKSDLGTVAFLCYQCHGKVDADFLDAHPDFNDEMIFLALMSPTRAANNTASPYDTHPVKYTSAYLSDSTLGIPEATDTTAFSALWPYMVDWADGKRDIECTSCHNPHDWNQENRRNYLRVAYYDSGAREADSTPAFRNVCSYCHTGRDDSGIGLNNQGTHPVGNIVATPGTFVMGSGYQGIWLDTAGGDTTTADPRFFMRNYFSTAGVAASRAGRAVGDRGGHLGPQGQFTCMSCHMPHGAPNSRDGVTSANDTFDLVAGPLLIKNNDASGFGTTPFGGFESATSHWLAESAFVISSGESNVCEWCHGITPKKTDTTESSDTNVVKAKYAHPVNNYPTSTADNTTKAYISNLASEIYSTVDLPLNIRYPVRNDAVETPWVNYEESGQPNAFMDSMGSTRTNTGQFLVCMSCHDAHFAQVGSPILRGPSSPEYCEDCHFTNPLPRGASHPLKWMVASQNCDSTTEDGGSLPNYANLWFETSNPQGSAVGGEVICRTCHGGPFQTGVIHGGFGRFMLADYIDFAELCVNCHGYDNHAGNPGTYSTAWLNTLRYGSATVKSANPSYWYKEGPSPAFRDSASIPPELYCTSRVGSHYVGALYAGRPYLTEPSYGWLGGTDTTQDHRGEIENTADVQKWLDTTWFRPMSSPSSAPRRMWTETGDLVGVSQYSIVGYISADVTKPVITCLSCHTPHGAAAGSDGHGPADNTTEADDWDGELLLATNAGSYICYICHYPAATHPTQYPDTTHIGHKRTPANAKNPDNRHDWVTRMEVIRDPYATISLYDTADPNKVLRESAVIYDSFRPANYPYGEMLCESCHSAHSANSRWGSYILEGDTTRANPEVYDSAWPVQAWGGFGTTGVHNKRPVNRHDVPDTVKSVNDRPTCEMCHPQGTE